MKALATCCSQTQLDHIENLILIVPLRNGSQKLVLVAAGLQENLYPFLIAYIPNELCDWTCFMQQSRNTPQG